MATVVAARAGTATAAVVAGGAAAAVVAAGGATATTMVAGGTTAPVARPGLEPLAEGGEDCLTLGRKLCPPRVFTMVRLERMGGGKVSEMILE